MRTNCPEDVENSKKDLIIIDSDEIPTKKSSSNIVSQRCSINSITNMYITLGPFCVGFETGRFCIVHLLHD